MEIAIQAEPKDAQVISELLSPWRISFASFDQADVVIVCGQKPSQGKKTIVVPSDSREFKKWNNETEARVSRVPGKPIFVAAGSQTVLSIAPRMLYIHDKSPNSVPEDGFPPAVELNEELSFTTINIVEEFEKILDEAMNASLSTFYRLATSSPVPYTVMPKIVRDILMKRSAEQHNLTFCDKLPLDALRFVLIGALERLTKQKLRKKTWNGKKSACLVTHDVDTQNGLHHAKTLKKLEDRYDLSSTWFLPSKHYRLEQETIRELADHCEIGAHDTKHDGKLWRLPEGKLAERLHEAKETLEKIVGRCVHGFRAPLLQHSFKITEAAREAGYAYDASVPTWEPKHPSTMGSHGVGTVFPLNLYGIVEIPLVLPQDHQLLHVLGMTPRQTLETWMKLKEEVKDIGGICTILVHPDYELAKHSNSGSYEEFLNNLAADVHAWTTVPNDLINMSQSVEH